MAGRRRVRIVHLCTRERFGGAATAAHRLHAALLEAGLPSRMLVQRRATPAPTVRGDAGPADRLLALARRRLDPLPLRRYPGRQGRDFSVNWVPGVSASRIERLEPDVVHVHWIGRGFVRPSTLGELGVPLVWTLHDMWAFTGGCHYSGGCTRFEAACGACPVLGSEREDDLSRRGWRRKERALDRAELTAVAPSRWMAERAGRSSILGDRRIEVIPNGLDVERYRPVERAEARRRLGLPEDVLLVGFGAVGADRDRRKGYPELVDVLRRLEADPAGRDLGLMTFGGSREREGTGIGMPEHRLGRLEDDDTLAMAYSAADVFVVPSLEDNLPNTVIESLACGTPVAAFAAGGVPELVEPGENGELAPVGDTAALADALAGLLADDEGRTRMGRRARERATREHAVGLQARRFRRLYREVAGMEAVAGT